MKENLHEETAMAAAGIGAQAQLSGYNNVETIWDSKGAFLFNEMMFGSTWHTRTKPPPAAPISAFRDLCSALYRLMQSAQKFCGQVC